MTVAFDNITVDKLLADLEEAEQGPRKAIAAAAEPVDDLDRPTVSLRKMLDELCAAQPDRLPWPDSWFDGLDPGDVAACRSLWAASLLTCLRSAIGESADEANGNLGISAVSGAWLGSRDFHMMCALAGFDGTAVFDRIQRIKDDPQLRADLRGQRPRVVPMSK